MCRQLGDGHEHCPSHQAETASFFFLSKYGMSGAQARLKLIVLRVTLNF